MQYITYVRYTGRAPHAIMATMVKLSGLRHPASVILSAMARLRGVENPGHLLLPALPAAGFLVILWFFINGATPITIAQPQANQPAGGISGTYTVGQTFYSPYSGLDRIDVVLATYARQNSGEVVFNLTSGPRSTQKLVTLRFDAASVQDNRPYSFEFPAIGDSAGKTYYFYFEALRAAPDNAITAWTDSRNPYPDGAAFLEGTPTEHDLSFKTYYHPNPWQLADVYLDRLARDRPGIWGSRAFYGVAFTAYVALIGVLFYFLYRWVVTARDRESW